MKSILISVKERIDEQKDFCSTKFVLQARGLFSNGTGARYVLRSKSKVSFCARVAIWSNLQTSVFGASFKVQLS